MYKNQRRIKELTPYISAVDIFRIYEREPGAAFLDSSLVNELGHYSVIGRCPYLKLVKDGENFTINGRPETETTFEDYMREYLNTHEDKNSSGLPIVSGAVGYFSYDYGRKQMGVPSGEKDLVTVPEAVLTFYDCFIIEDCQEKEPILCQMESVQTLQQKSERWKKQSGNLQRRGNRKDRNRGKRNPETGWSRKILTVRNSGSRFIPILKKKNTSRQ